MIPLNQIGRRVAIGARALSEVAIPYAKRNKANLAMMGGGLAGAGFFNNRRARDGGGAVNYGGMAAGLGLAAFGGYKGGVANLFSKRGINSLVRGSETAFESGGSKYTGRVGGINAAAGRASKKAGKFDEFSKFAPEKAAENWTKPNKIPINTSPTNSNPYRGMNRKFRKMDRQTNAIGSMYGNRTSSQFEGMADINRGASSLLGNMAEWMGGGNL